MHYETGEPVAAELVANTGCKRKSTRARTRPEVTNVNCLSFMCRVRTDVVVLRTHLCPLCLGGMLVSSFLVTSVFAKTYQFQPMF